MPITTPWIEDLESKGWAVVKGVVPEAKAAAYASAGLDWLEKFPLGFKREDVSTWGRQHLPDHWKNGVFNLFVPLLSLLSHYVNPLFSTKLWGRS